MASFTGPLAGVAFDELFELGATIGSGAYGVVRLCKRRNNGETLVCKQLVVGDKCAAPLDPLTRP